MKITRRELFMVPGLSGQKPSTHTSRDDAILQARTVELEDLFGGDLSYTTCYQIAQRAERVVHILGQVMEIEDD